VGTDGKGGYRDRITRTMNVPPERSLHHVMWELVSTKERGNG